MVEKVYDFDPQNLPQDILAAIGAVSAASAMAEHIIEQGIGGCLGVDFEYTAAVTTHMTNPLRDDALRAIAEIRIDNVDDLDLLDQILDDLKDAFRRRNSYLHNGWCQDPSTKEIYTVKTEARGSVEMGLIPMPIDKIKADSQFIYLAGMKLYTFLGSRNLLAPIPSAPRPRGHKTKAARKKLREALKKGE